MELKSDMQEYRAQLNNGHIQKAYRGLMEYMAALRTHIEKACPQFTVPGGLYAGYMDMTYFSIVPEALKQRSLKIAVVFLHESFRFEVWLSGVNRQVQERYWNTLKASGNCAYPLVAQIKGSDAIIEHILVEDPDFSDTNALTKAIEAGVASFITDIEGILAGLPPA